MPNYADGYYSLNQNVNKYNEGNKPETSEGPSFLLDELELTMDDEELLDLKKKWETKFQPIKMEMEKKWERNQNYWLGKTFTTIDDTAEDRPLADNVIFEALESFLPVATKQNPEPVVDADNTKEGNILADNVRLMLANLADTLSLKIQIKKMVRQWSLYYIGVAKVGWSQKNNDISLAIIRPHKIIIDPEATIDNGEYTGEYIGEYRCDTAENLMRRFPKKATLIKEMVKDKMGTDVTYIEWWTDDYVFWSVKDEIIGKVKNPHWNYEGEETMDEYGQPIEGEPNNHFPNRKKPYIFLSVFNLGLKPFDDTGLVEQVISTQDLINKRLKQIDRNADGTNGGAVVSGDHFTKEQAGSVAKVLRKGGTLYVPTGDVNRAYRRDIAPPLPSFVYQSLQDYRASLMRVFGVTGVTSSGTKQEQTVRGKIMVRQQDTDRIGGGITEYIEQVVDNIFNWWVQLMYVYYDEPHSAAVIGKDRARQYITIKNSDLNRKLTVTVKEGSLIPKDSLTKRNEAIELWGAGALDPISLFAALDFPNPLESAKQLIIWKTNPMALIPDMAPPMQPGQPPGGQAPAGGQPSSQASNMPDVMGASNQPIQPPPININQVPT